MTHKGNKGNVPVIAPGPATGTYPFMVIVGEKYVYPGTVGAPETDTQKS